MQPIDRAAVEAASRDLLMTLGADLEDERLRETPRRMADARDEWIVGLSKLARVVERFARRLQLQERQTVQVADLLQQQLRPNGAGVVLEAEHFCMSLRGIAKPGAHPRTSALHGLVRDDPRTRQESLALAVS